MVEQAGLGYDVEVLTQRTKLVLPLTRCAPAFVGPLFAAALVGCPPSSPGGEGAEPEPGKAVDRATANTAMKRRAPDPRPLATVLSQDGLSAAVAKLDLMPDTPENAFLLGGMRFLQAFEEVFKIRFASYRSSLAVIPGMRTRLPPNPNGEFDPQFLERAMKAALPLLADANNALGPAVAGTFAAEVDLRDVWFDVDADGKRAKWEGLLQLLDFARSLPSDASTVVKFDTADAEWLMAYVHLATALAELTVAVDPTPAIRTVYEGRAQIDKLGRLGALGFTRDPSLPDVVAAVLLALDGRPDPARTRRSHRHFKQMIAHNRTFWTEVNAETDDDHEWLPNAGQTSAFGVRVNEATAESWQNVLTEIEQILDGRLLVPFWRFDAESKVGVNIRKFFENPPDLDVVKLMQGASVAPYLERGELADGRALRAFSRLTRANPLVMAAWFN